MKNLLLANIFLSFFIVSSAQSRLKNLTVVAAYLPANTSHTGRGREADLVKAVLSCSGYSVEYDVQPYARHFVSYKEVKKYDAVITVPGDMKLPGYDSLSHINYQNGVSTLENGKIVRSLTDLKGQKVVSFKGAINIIPGLKKATSLMKSYEEMSRQDIHSQMLFTKKIDAVISDGLIFSAHNELLREKHYSNPYYHQKTKFRAIFPPNPFKIVFKSEKVRDLFNLCYKKLKTNGKLQRIHNRHLEKHEETLGNQYPRM